MSGELTKILIVLGVYNWSDGRQYTGEWKYNKKLTKGLTQLPC